MTINENEYLPTGTTDDKKYRALIIEDDFITQKLHTALLQRLGFEVSLASTAKQALELANQDYDLILLDVGLPDQTGDQLIKPLRAYPQHHNTTLFIVTSHFNESLKQECLAAGANAVLQKPLTLKKIQENIKMFSCIT